MIWHELISWSEHRFILQHTHTRVCEHTRMCILYKEEAETTIILTKTKIPWKNIIHIEPFRYEVKVAFLQKRTGSVFS